MVPKADSGAFLLLFLLVLTVTEPLRPDVADDDDDPEYNFLEDLDEPDTEDFRTDRAIRITSEKGSEQTNGRAI